MSEIFLDTLTGLLEAIAIERGELPLVEKENTIAKTYYSPSKNKASKLAN